MSFGNQFAADAEMDRRLQEEFRRRQALQQGMAGQQQGFALPVARGPADYAAHLGMLGGGDSGQHHHHAQQQAYYQRGPVHPSAYGSAYGLDQQARVSYAQLPQNAQNADASLARLYAEQQRRQQEAAQMAAQNYGVYGQQGLMNEQQRYAAAYGIPMQQQQPAYGRDTFGAPPPTSAQDLPILQPPLKASSADGKTSKSYSMANAGQDELPSEESLPPSPLRPLGQRPPGPKPRGTKGPSAAKQKKDAVPKRKQVGRTVEDEDGNQVWWTGAVPLGLDDDKYWLSELQVYLRANFAEVFGATEDDIAAPMHGRNKPIALGQVGVRCIHCKGDNAAERGQQATSYPSLISGIYNSVQQMLRLHMDCCLSMPMDVRQKIEQLKLSCSSRGGRKQYWVDSAKRLGLTDTPHGIHFGRDPLGPLPPLTGPSVNSRENKRKKTATKEKPEPKLPKKEIKEHEEEEVYFDEDKPAMPVDTRPLVFPEDKPLISDYLYLTLEQMAPCTLMEADRVGCYKTRKVGFPGLACKHCVGQAGCGRYFPASEASLSQTTTSQTIMNHVRNCRRCPLEIRENLEIMKRNKVGPDRKRGSNKPKHGGRKVFFHRLWCRIQGLPFEEGRAETKESKRKSRKTSPSKRRGKKHDDETESDDSDDSEDEESGSENETESDGSENDSKPRAKGSKGRTGKKKTPWFDGCVRLTKTDDPHWLSEMEAFARSELVEVYSHRKNEGLEGYSGRKEPAVGQVGVRCVFCKSADPEDRSNGCVTFPDSLSTVHTKIGDMIRLHFPTCPSMPEDARGTFRSLRGYDAKVADDDSQQYWVDSARDIGLSNIPAEGSKGPGWGITFRRDPLQPSPADELDLEDAEDENATYEKNVLVRPSDRGECTDQVILLLRQVRPCRFKKSDRRAGPGSRGRDRAMGFPGLACMHCANKTTIGRYFPVSSKNMTDNTVTSLQTHVASCSRCPEPIRASLAYLSHRSILQKAELSGSWKKAYFKKVWERLHNDRNWTAIDDEADEDHSSGDESMHEEKEYDEDVSKEEDGEEEGSDEDKEELGENMNALIKAAAIWLTEQDQANDPSKSSTRAAKGRSLPAKRNGGGRSTSALPTKRRRAKLS